MQGYTFTTWDQIETWIRDNGLVKWTFATGRTDSESESRKLGDVIANSEWYNGELDHKLQMTRKQLESQAGRYLYGSGYHTTNGTQGCCICDVQLPGQQTQQPTMGVGAPAIYQQPFDREEMKRELAAQIRYEIGRESLESDRKAFEREREEFRKDKEGVWGVAIHYLKPLAQQLLNSQTHQPMARVAGVPEDAPIATEAEAEEPEIFTDEESAELFDLMARFKQVEPEYLTMIRKVVEMAESGDSNYKLARGFLC